jgi:hypothetical protein
MGIVRFEETDLHDELPGPGLYGATITTARLRRSASGNRMVHIVFALEGVVPGHDRVAEYFVLEGASGRGLALARRRLVELYRACGLEPRPGDEIAPEDLVGTRVEVKLEHETWQGEMRLRVVGHRRLAGGIDRVEESVPF